MKVSLRSEIRFIGGWLASDGEPAGSGDGVAERRLVNLLRVHGVAHVEEGRLQSPQVDDAVEASFGLVGDEFEDREPRRKHAGDVEGDVEGVVGRARGGRC